MQLINIPNLVSTLNCAIDKELQINNINNYFKKAKNLLKEDCKLGTCSTIIDNNINKQIQDVQKIDTHIQNLKQVIITQAIVINTKITETGENKNAV
jgi:hypothetical protein